MIKTRAVIPKVNWKETTSFIKQCSPTESYFYKDITFCLISYSLVFDVDFPKQAKNIIN